MQVFIIGSPLETARILDKRRLNKQIIECNQILNALRGKKTWRNHPAVLEYKGYEKWLTWYRSCLEWYVLGNISWANTCSIKASEATPPFHTKDFFNQMKRRLYTKDNNHYKQYAYLGESQENWYFVDGVMRKYINGKRKE